MGDDAENARARQWVKREPWECSDSRFVSVLVFFSSFTTGKPPTCFSKRALKRSRSESRESVEWDPLIASADVASVSVPTESSESRTLLPVFSMKLAMNDR